MTMIIGLPLVSEPGVHLEQAFADPFSGYASVGLFNDHSHDGDLGGTMPQPPVTGGENC